MSTEQPAAPADPTPTAQAPLMFEAGVDELVIDPNNFRVHTERNLELISQSVDGVGMGRSIVVDETGKVLAGNGTLQVAKKLGKKRVIVVQGDRDTIIAVQRTDLSENEKIKLALLDNKAGEAAKWDQKRLKKLAETEPGQGILAGIFDEREMRRIVVKQEEAQPLADGGAEEADPELKEAAKTEVDQTKAPGSQVRMVQLFLTVDTQALFILRVRELAGRFGTKSITDTVDEAIKQMHAQLCAAPAAPATEQA